MNFAIYISVLTMGFMGSMHCGVMCGPLSCNFKNQKQLISYHIGRLVSYLCIFLILFLSSHFLIGSESRGVKLTASVFFSLFFVIYGLVQLKFITRPNLNFKIYKIQFMVLKHYKELIDRFPLFLGLFTGLFPCSWLYSFLFFSTQIQFITDALIAIILFWLSSLPAFFIFNSLLQKLIKQSPFTHQRISGFMLICAGIFSVASHWADVLFAKM